MRGLLYSSGIRRLGFGICVAGGVSLMMLYSTNQLNGDGSASPSETQEIRQALAELVEHRGDFFPVQQAAYEKILGMCGRKLSREQRDALESGLLAIVRDQRVHDERGYYRIEGAEKAIRLLGHLRVSRAVGTLAKYIAFPRYADLSLPSPGLPMLGIDGGYFNQTIEQEFPATAALIEIGPNSILPVAEGLNRYGAKRPLRAMVYTKVLYELAKEYPFARKLLSVKRDSDQLVDAYARLFDANPDLRVGEF